MTPGAAACHQGGPLLPPHCIRPNRKARTARRGGSGAGLWVPASGAKWGDSVTDHVSGRPKPNMVTDHVSRKLTGQQQRIVAACDVPRLNEDVVMLSP